MFRGKIQLLKHREFTLGDSDMILIIMTSLLNIEIRNGNVILIAHEQGKARYSKMKLLLFHSLALSTIITKNRFCHLRPPA